MHLDCGSCVIRSWRLEDAEAVVRHANNRKIWLQLRDRFPHPYSMADAERFLLSARDAKPEREFAIAVGEEAAGGIGFTLGTDVERCSAELGYWLGEAFWGRGITTAAVKAATQYAMTTYNLTRVFAIPFDNNPASCRVLEKAGFVREGVMRRSAIKDGQVMDQVLYAFTGEAEKKPQRRYEVERSARHAERPGFHVNEIQIGPTQKVPWHYHTTVQDTFYILQGRIRLSLRDPEEERILSRGETFTVAPKRPHLVTNAGEGSAVFLVLQGFGEYDFVPLT